MPRPVRVVPRQPPLYYDMASYTFGRRPIVLVHVDIRSIIDDWNAQRALSAFRRWVPGLEIVLAGRQRNGTVKFVGPSDVVAALQGKALTEFEWRRKAVD